MSGKKEAYEREMKTVEFVLLPEIGQTIRAYVEELEKEVVELRLSLGREMEHRAGLEGDNERLGMAGIEQERELAELRRERDQWKHDATKYSRRITELVKLRDELEGDVERWREYGRRCNENTRAWMRKISEAPKVWMHLIDGEVVGCAKARYPDTDTMEQRQVHAVPVEDSQFANREQDEKQEAK